MKKLFYWILALSLLLVFGCAQEKPEAAAKPEPAAQREKPKAAGGVSANAVLDYLASHPDGVKMTELESRLGSSRIVMARLMKDLMASNRVRKDERQRLYFKV